MMKRTNKITAIALSALITVNMAVPSIAFAKTSIEKDESIFVNMDSDGKIESQIGSVWLHSDKNINYSEETKLKDIKNLKGKEEFKLESDRLSWDLASNEVYYQGNLDEKMPLDIRVSYSLDGKTVKKEDLKDVSGNLKINVDMVNRDEEFKLMNGKNQKIYVPHAALTTMIFDVDEVSNVKINSGKIVNEGKKVVATNLSMPGMNEIFEDKLEDLDVDLDKLFKDTMEVEMEVKDFTMPSIMVVIADEDLDTEKIDKANDLDELLDGLNELKENSDKIMDGITELNKGSKELQDGTNQLSDGVSKLSDGGNKLYDGVLKLSDNTPKLVAGSKQLEDGMNKLGGGLNELSSGTSKLEEKSKLIGTSSSQLYAGSVQLDDGINELVAAIKPLLALNADKGKIEMINQIENFAKGTLQVLSSLDGSANEIVASLEGLNNQSIQLGQLIEQTAPGEEDKENVKLIAANQGLVAVKAGIDNQIEGLNKKLGQMQAQAQGLNELKLGAQTIIEKCEALKQGLNPEAGNEEMEAKLNQLLAGSNQLRSGLEQFSTGLNNELLPGISQLKAASDQLSQGSSQLSIGFAELNKGLNTLGNGVNPLLAGSQQLRDGLNTLDSKTGDLTDGVKKLNEGTAELEEGYSKFNKEGIYKLTDEAKEKTDSIKDLIELKDAVFDLAKDRYSITGRAVDMDVVLTQKYIIKID